MGLEMVRVGSKQKNIYVELNEVGIKRISARPYKIDTDPNGIIWIKYKKSQKKQFISAGDVYDGKFKKDFFENKYVLIGSSAQGLFDLVKTPLGVTIPGVEVHANVIENILDPSGEKKISVARTMPNTPALVLEGMTAICFSSQVSKVNVEVAHYIFKAIGETVTIDENSIDAVTGLSGSGPAYILMIIEALSDAGVKVGLSRETANKLTMQTVLGTAKLVRDSAKHPGELKDMVTSPGGTTIAGLHKLEAGGLRNTLINAVEAATTRSRELGKKYS